MGRPDTITMSMRELDRCKVIEAVVRDGLMVWRAAEKLGISRRQIERLAQRYRQDGPQGNLATSHFLRRHHVVCSHWLRPYRVPAPRKRPAIRRR